MEDRCVNGIDSDNILMLTTQGILGLWCLRVGLPKQIRTIYFGGWIRLIEEPKTVEAAQWIGERDIVSEVLEKGDKLLEIARTLLRKKSRPEKVIWEILLA